MSVDLRTKVDWIRYLRMVVSLQSDVSFIEFVDGDQWQPEIRDELESLHEACQKAEACIWRLSKLMNTKDVSKDKEVE